MLTCWPFLASLWMTAGTILYSPWLWRGASGRIEQMDDKHRKSCSAENINISSHFYFNTRITFFKSPLDVLNKSVWEKSWYETSLFDVSVRLFVSTRKKEIKEISREDLFFGDYIFRNKKKQQILYSNFIFCFVIVSHRG